MIDLTKTFFFIFGLITLIGGIQGYMGPAASKASLVAGGIAGVLLLLAGYLLMGTSIQGGLILGLIVCLGLAGRFLPLFFKTRDLWPAGVEGILGLFGLVFAILALLKK